MVKVVAIEKRNNWRGYSELESNLWLQWTAGLSSTTFFGALAQRQAVIDLTTKRIELALQLEDTIKSYCCTGNFLPCTMTLMKIR